MKKNIFLLLGLVMVFLTRVVLLGQFPTGITHDELNYVIAAKSLFWAGSFAPGTAPALLPTSMSHFNVVIAEVPAMFLSILIGLLPTTLFTARFVAMILGVLTGLAIYLLVEKLTNSKKVALVSLFVYIINPWAYLTGRTIFEVNFFVAFFFWGFWLLLRYQGWKIFISLPFFLLGFFSYTGGQISFYLFTVLVLVYRYWIGRNKRHLKPYLLFGGIISLTFLGYLGVTLHNQSFASRGGELYLPSNQEVGRLVDQERSRSVASSLNKYFVNKYTVYFRGYGDKYLNAFSVNNLFVNGEVRAAFSFQKHGTFYFWDGLFILVGFCWLFVYSRKTWLLFLLLIFISPLTAGLNTVEYSYSQRAGLMYPLLIILSGMGIGFVLNSIKLNKGRYFLSVLIFVLYTTSFINLLHLYFYRFPIYASDGWFFQDRVLARYLALNDKESVVYTSEPKIIFQEYLFYNNLYNKDNIKAINLDMDKKIYQLGKVSFTDLCPEVFDNKKTLIFDGKINCKNLPDKNKAIRITRLSDVFEEYLIYKDLVCGDFELNRYVPLSVFGQWQVEKQTAEEFCQNWITKL